MQFIIHIMGSKTHVLLRKKLIVFFGKFYFVILINEKSLQL